MREDVETAWRIMSKYSYLPLEGTGKRPVRSVAIPRATVGCKRRVERKGGKVNASAGGDRRTCHTELRMEEAIWGRVEERPLRSRSRCPYELEREEGGNLRTRTREAVRVGIHWINPRAMARVKVEMEGEPKER